MSEYEPEGISSASGIFTGLRQTVQALAAPADLQRASLPQGVRGAGELALAFEHRRDAVLDSHQDYLSAAQLTALDHLGRFLDAMSGPDDPGLWGDDALRARTEWGTVRALAGAVLDAFGWPRADRPRGAGD